MRNLFLVYFVNMYMFRAYLGPSSGGTTVCIQQLVLIGSIDCKKKLQKTVHSSLLLGCFYLFTCYILIVSCVLLLVLSCLLGNCYWLTVCIVVVGLCVCCYLMCICCTMCLFFIFTLNAGLLATGQYSEGPATGHLDTGFS